MHRRNRLFCKCFADPVQRWRGTIEIQYEEQQKEAEGNCQRRPMRYRVHFAGIRTRFCVSDLCPVFGAVFQLFRRIIEELFEFLDLRIEGIATTSVLPGRKSDFSLLRCSLSDCAAPAFCIAAYLHGFDYVGLNDAEH